MRWVSPPVSSRFSGNASIIVVLVVACMLATFMEVRMLSVGGLCGFEGHTCSSQAVQQACTSVGSWMSHVGPRNGCLEWRTRTRGGLGLLVVAKVLGRAKNFDHRTSVHLEILNFNII